MSADAVRLREDIRKLEEKIGQCEDDKTSKDNQIRTLKVSTSCSFVQLLVVVDVDWEEL